MPNAGLAHTGASIARRRTSPITTPPTCTRQSTGASDGTITTGAPGCAAEASVTASAFASHASYAGGAAR
jgi:hypothetical protein